MSPDDVVGTYNGRTYCAPACHQDAMKYDYDVGGMKAVLIDHFAFRIKHRFGDDIDVLPEPHIYIDRNLKVSQISFKARFSFQDTRTCEFKSTWEEPITMAQALERKLDLFCPNGDLVALKEFLHQQEGFLLTPA
jgi:hypothetical protein